jgi:hypothetical protein
MPHPNMELVIKTSHSHAKVALSATTRANLSCCCCCGIIYTPKQTDCSIEFLTIS